MLLSTLTCSVESLLHGVDAIAAERRAELDRLADFLVARPIELTFICTGNSRRSHLAQMWAAAAAHHYGIDRVGTYSGGTDPSAFDPRTSAALERSGFVIERQEPDGENPRSLVHYAEGAPPIAAFSKRYDDPVNPQHDFVAIMTCGEADQNCPLIRGAVLRVSLTYEDPKVADDTPEESARYDERSRQIATEMLYLFARVRSR